MAQIENVLIPVPLLHRTVIAVGVTSELGKQLDKFLFAGYDFEVEPTKEMGTDTHVCPPHEATQYSVYRRPRVADVYGHRLAEWQADCSTEGMAHLLAHTLRDMQDNSTQDA